MQFSCSIDRWKSIGNISQRRNVNPLDFRVKSDFSTFITSLDDA